jgi:hypothetical protein
MMLPELCAQSSALAERFANPAVRTTAWLAVILAVF